MRRELGEGVGADCTARAEGGGAGAYCTRRGLGGGAGADRFMHRRGYRYEGVLQGIGHGRVGGERVR